jgi:HlyD family secretion protein
MFSRKKIIWFSVAAATLIALLIYAGVRKNAQGTTVETTKISNKTITEIIPANGKIQPVVEVKISPDVSGEIVELDFEEGDDIRQGELILKIKQDVYISIRDRAEASLNSVKAQLSQQKAQFIQTEQEYLRNKKLYDQDAISESEYEASHARYEVAKAQIEAAEFNVKSSEAALKEAEENLTKTVIYSPMDGVISRMDVEKGERVVGTSQMAGTEMLRIANFDKMEVLVDVNENDIIRIEQGDTAEIDVDAYPSRSFLGVVTQIANSAKSAGTSLDQVTNFEVKIYILPESYRDLTAGNKLPFRPGMSASVSIRTDSRENVLAIPLRAITTRDDLLEDSVKNSLGLNESIEQVFVLNSDNTVSVRKITTGIQDLYDIEILTGLSDKDVIVTGPFNAISRTLKEGSLVTPQEEN